MITAAIIGAAVAVATTAASIGVSVHQGNEAKEQQKEAAENAQAAELAAAHEKAKLAAETSSNGVIALVRSRIDDDRALDPKSRARSGGYSRVEPSRARAPQIRPSGSPEFPSQPTAQRTG